MGRVETQVEELPENKVRLTVEVPRDAIQHAVWAKLEVPAPEPEVPAELVEAELNALREAVAELAPAERPVQEGDTAVVDLVSPSGEAQRDYVVEVGAGRLVEEIELGLVAM